MGTQRDRDTKWLIFSCVVVDFLETHYTAGKLSEFGVFPGPYPPAIVLKREIERVKLRIESDCGKLWTRKNFEFGHFSRRVNYRNVKIFALKSIKLLHLLKDYILEHYSKTQERQVPVGIIKNKFILANLFYLKNMLINCIIP